jgi:recombinational DNA repair ATPase RecF
MTELNKKRIVIIGDNGTGKTSIVQAQLELNPHVKEQTTNEVEQSEDAAANARDTQNKDKKKKNADSDSDDDDDDDEEEKRAIEAEIDKKLVFSTMNSDNKTVRVLNFLTVEKLEKKKLMKLNYKK